MNRNEDATTPTGGTPSCLNCENWREGFYDHPLGTGECLAIHSSDSDRYAAEDHAYMVTFGEPTDELSFMTEEWFCCSLHKPITQPRNRWDL